MQVLLLNTVFFFNPLHLSDNYRLYYRIQCTVIDKSTQQSKVVQLSLPPPAITLKSNNQILYNITLTSGNW